MKDGYFGDKVEKDANIKMYIFKLHFNVFSITFGVAIYQDSSFIVIWRNKMSVKDERWVFISDLIDIH